MAELRSLPVNARPCSRLWLCALMCAIITYNDPILTSRFDCGRGLTGRRADVPDPEGWRADVPDPEGWRADVPDPEGWRADVPDPEDTGVY